jgi:hypothetical protein
MVRSIFQFRGNHPKMPLTLPQLERHLFKAADLGTYGQKLHRTTWRMARINLENPDINSGQSAQGDIIHNDRHTGLKADFIVWQVNADRQQVAFVDPKGIRNVGLKDPKISFFETVKDIEKRLGDPSIVLDSFIVSNTPSHVMRKQWGIEKPEMAKRHIVFQDEDKDAYIGTILQAAGGGNA